jgi:hypothetical protein
MRHPKVIEFERKLKRLFDSIDDHLEGKYGGLYSLHPARPKRGKTSNKEQDGLFNIGASFSPGYGSQYGRGYVVDVAMVTLEQIPKDVREKIEFETLQLIRKKIQEYFPERDLSVHKDGNTYKIHGDLRLY